MNRRIIFHAPRDIRLEEAPIPSPGSGEIVVKLGAALTCGTDFKAYRQGHHVLLGDYPSPFGHELAGTVTALGKGVTTAKEGDRVVVANSAPMDDCYWCRSGQNQLCPNLKLHNGAYAEYDLVPAHIVARNLHPLKASVAFEIGALAEPFACAIHACDIHAVRPGETALVIGAGPMSLLLIHALRARGARVAVLGRSKEHLAASVTAGAAAIFSVLDGAPDEAIRAWADRWGPDHVFEAVGKAETYLQAVELVRPGGKVCLFGGCALGTTVPFDVHRLHYKQIALHGVFHHTPPHFREAVRLLSEGQVKTELLVKGAVKLADIPLFFAANADKTIPKAVVTP
ncbi:MAG: alcohol dehydrogenase catalytic domain-containing protein, partial [Elusimicrobia bacterium]|nr:alcohol dehydrogenase catalytic domain-containing protein [Elusimicrobiota bacterium]